MGPPIPLWAMDLTYQVLKHRVWPARAHTAALAEYETFLCQKVLPGPPARYQRSLCHNREGFSEMRTSCNAHIPKGRAARHDAQFFRRSLPCHRDTVIQRVALGNLFNT